MGPKRSLSPTSAAAELADAKRQAVEEQRLRAEEWAKKFLKSPSPKKTARSSIGGIAIAEHNPKEIEETPVKVSKKRLSSVLPPSTPKLNKKAKKNDNGDASDNDDVSSSNHETNYRSAATPNRKTSVQTEIVEAHTSSAPPPNVSASTPKRRRNFDIPEESLNAALNPPKLSSSVTKRFPPSPSASYSGIGVSQTVSDQQQRPKTQASQPAEDDINSAAAVPSTSSVAKASHRSSFSALTGKSNHVYESSNDVQKDDQPEPDQKIVTEKRSVSTNVSPIVTATAVPPSSSVEQLSVNVEGKVTDPPLATLPSETDTPSTWDTIVPYLWIIIYIQLLAILVVVLFYADTRLIGVTTIAVSLLRRFFYYFV